MAKENEKYNGTINLPKPLLRMKANLPQTEETWLRFWEDDNVFEKALERRKNSPLFVLHDGPPYANGDIHLGTALNKVLKDAVNKYKLLRGFKTPYVPGWDTHGLPIEQQVTKQTKINPEDFAVTEWRDKCRDFALSYIDKQMKSFKRLGVLGLWKDYYATFKPEYEGKELEILADLAENGFVIRKRRPVYWCPHCKTTLAEAEIEYREKVSPSIFVAFPAKSGSYKAIAWTTTPWTLPDNVALAFHPEENYVFVNTGEDTFVVAEKRLQDVAKELSWLDYEIVASKPGAAFEDERFEHPVYDDKETVAILADFVSMEDGTGIVHIAPGHGEEDYLVWEEKELDFPMMIDDGGRFTEQAGFLAGVFYADANDMVLDLLTKKGKLLHKGMVTHSYPHCWRCHNPVIFRALSQWFIDVDLYRDEALGALKEVQWIPTGSDVRIGDMVKSRPDWCLSRQRIWGVPIPSIKCSHCGRSILDPRVVRNVAAAVRKEGSNIWYSEPLETFLPAKMECPDCGSKDFDKEYDILDVWFDSGVSHYAVLEQYDGMRWPADLYLEGYDQHRGWFQTSLLTAVPLRGQAPFKTVLSHGFVLDESGRAMSKSLGNVIDPSDVVSKVGADVLRLALLMSDYTADIQVGQNILNQASEIYKKIRNTFRFMEGNLFDFQSTEQVPFEEMKPLDRWILGLWTDMKRKLSSAFDNYEFYSFVSIFHSFCVKELSSIYLDAIKSRLYLKKPDSEERRSAQTALKIMATEFPVLIAPILTFTAEEMWQALVSRGLVMEKSVYFSDWPDSAFSLTEEESSFWENALRLREKANEQMEKLRQDKIIGHSLDASVIVYGSGTDFLSHSEWAEFLVVSSAQIKNEGKEWDLEVEKALGVKCARCWRVREDVGLDAEYPDICGECLDDITG